MKKYLALLLTLVVSLFATTSFAFTPPAAPANGYYVSDQAGKMSAEQIAQLNQKIERISKATKNEFGVLLLQDMDGADISDVANATFKAWGVGKHGLDNGCLIVVAIKERKSRIETGKGVEGEVTDLQAKDILDNTLRPHLKKGDFAGGFSDTLDALSSLMESRQNKTASPVTSKDDHLTVTRTGNSETSGCDVSAAGSDGSGMLTGLLVLVGCVGVLLLFRRAAKKREEANLLAMQDAEAQLARERRATAERNRQRDERLRVAREAREAAARNVSHATPVVSTPVVHAQTVTPPKPVRQPAPTVSNAVKVAAVVGAVGTVAALDALEEERKAAAAKAKKQREQEEEDRRRRQREDDDRRRRDEESSRSSYSSSSSYDYSSSSGGGFDSGGGGFGGGDSGGGGASSDW